MLFLSHFFGKVKRGFLLILSGFDAADPSPLARADPEAALFEMSMTLLAFSLTRLDDLNNSHIHNFQAPQPRRQRCRSRMSCCTSPTAMMCRRRSLKSRPCNRICGCRCFRFVLDLSSVLELECMKMGKPRPYFSPGCFRLPVK